MKMFNQQFSKYDVNRTKIYSVYIRENKKTSINAYDAAN